MGDELVNVFEVERSQTEGCFGFEVGNAVFEADYLVVFGRQEDYLD